MRAHQVLPEVFVGRRPRNLFLDPMSVLRDEERAQHAPGVAVNVHGAVYPPEGRVKRNEHLTPELSKVVEEFVRVVHTEDIVEQRSVDNNRYPQVATRIFAFDERDQVVALEVFEQVSDRARVGADADCVRAVSRVVACVRKNRGGKGSFFFGVGWG